MRKRTGELVFDTQWPVQDDYGYSEVHVAVYKDGTEFWFWSCYGGPFGNANGQDCARFLGTPDLEQAGSFAVGNLKADTLGGGGFVPNPGDGTYAAELAEEFFGVGLDLATYEHDAF